MKSRSLIVFCMAMLYASASMSQFSILLNPTNPTCTNTCGGSITVLISGGNNGPFKYAWSNGDTTTSLNSQCAGSYSVTVTDALSNTATDAATLVVPILEDVTITATRDTLVYSNDSIELCVTQAFAQYHWNTFPDPATQCNKVKDAGSYKVTVTDNNGCTAVSNTMEISACPVFTRSITIEAHGDTIIYSVPGDPICPMQFMQVHKDSINGVHQVVGVDTGDYYLVLQFDGTCCANFYTQTYFWYQYTGINDLELDKLVLVSPNPSNTNGWQLTVSKELLNEKAQLFDSQGKMVYSTTIQKLHTSINPDLATGIYLLHIRSGQSSLVRKLVKL